MKEINKYFLKDSVLKYLEKDYSKTVSKEYVVVQNSCKSILYKQINKKYEKIVYYKNDSVKVCEISKDDYKNNIKKATTSIILKEIFFLTKDSFIVKYDNFIVLCSDEEKIIEKFSTYIKEKILDHKKYSDLYFLMYENQIKNDFNIYKVFKKIDQKRDIDISKYIKPNLQIKKAVKIKLYKSLNDMKYLQQLLSKNSNNLDKLILNYRRNLLVALYLLKEYEIFLYSDFTKMVYSNLENICKKTDFIERLESIKKLMILYKKCLSEKKYFNFLSAHDKNISNKVENFIAFLNTKEYEIVLDQFENLIKENSIKLSTNEPSKTTKIAIQKSMKKSFKKVKKAYKEYFDCFDKKSYKIILANIQNLTQVNNLSTKDINFYKRKHLTYKLEKNILKILHIKENYEISQKVIKNKKDLRCINKRLKKKEKIVLKKIKKNIKRFKKAKNLFVG